MAKRKSRKLTPEQQKLIREMREHDKSPIYVLSRKFGVSDSTIYHVLNFRGPYTKEKDDGKEESSTEGKG